MVLPAIQQRPGVNLPASFLADLPYHAVERIFAQLKLPARQFPFLPLVFQEQHLAVLDGDAFDRDGKGVREMVRRGNIQLAAPGSRLLLRL